MKIKDPEHFFIGLAAAIFVIMFYVLFLYGLVFTWWATDWTVFSKIMCTLAVLAGLCLFTGFIASVYKDE